MCIMIERRLIGLSHSNPMISSTTGSPSSTNHQHGTVTSAIVTPEADLVSGLNLSITLGLMKSVSALVLAAVLHVTTPKTLITGPDCAVSKVAVTCDFRAECLSTQTVTCGVQQSCVAGVVTAGDLELCAIHGPKRRREHVCVVCRIGRLTNGRFSVVPILAAVFHPVFGVFIGKASN